MQVWLVVFIVFLFVCGSLFYRLYVWRQQQIILAAAERRKSSVAVPVKKISLSQDEIGTNEFTNELRKPYERKTTISGQLPDGFVLYCIEEEIAKQNAAKNSSQDNSKMDPRATPVSEGSVARPVILDAADIAISGLDYYATKQTLQAMRYFLLQNHKPIAVISGYLDFSYDPFVLQKIERLQEMGFIHRADIADDMEIIAAAHLYDGIVISNALFSDPSNTKDHSRDAALRKLKNEGKIFRFRFEEGRFVPNPGWFWKRDGSDATQKLNGAKKEEALLLIDELLTSARLLRDRVVKMQGEM